jgi:hypothetical protein
MAPYSTTWPCCIDRDSQKNLQGTNTPAYLPGASATNQITFTTTTFLTFFCLNDVVVI